MGWTDNPCHPCQFLALLTLTDIVTPVIVKKSLAYNPKQLSYFYRYRF